MLVVATVQPFLVHAPGGCSLQKRQQEINTSINTDIRSSKMLAMIVMFRSLQAKSSELL